MSYSEADGQVVLKITSQTYANLLMMLGMAGRTLHPDHMLLHVLLNVRDRITERETL